MQMTDIRCAEVYACWFVTVQKQSFKKKLWLNRLNHSIAVCERFVFD